jgi:tetratricopeptide (TPR) repeat protein
MYREAIETYTGIAGDNPIVWNKMGIAWNQLGQLDKAMKDYQHSLKLRPQYAEAQNNIGTVYYADKSYRRAIGAYRKALRITPDSASFHMNLGTAYMARKMEKEATVEFQAALKIDPDAFENHGTGGTTLEERSVDEKARYHYTWAKIYASENRPELALQYLRKALEEGFKDRKKMEHDAEFDALRDTPEFKELIDAYRSRQERCRRSSCSPRRWPHARAAPPRRSFSAWRFCVSKTSAQTWPRIGSAAPFPKW